MKESVTIKAPAKVNLFLRIVGRRADGYHELESLMQKIDLTDTLRLVKTDEGISLSCPATDLPCDENNLAFKAAKAFMNAVPVDHGVQITLEKRIPVAAGLGGGSSDAAAVLRGFNSLCGEPLTEKELVDLARPLGADVPFFVYDFDAAWARGIGDDIKKNKSVKNCWFVLVNPGFPVSTKWVYQNFALTMKSNPYMLARGKQGKRKYNLSLWGKDVPLYNDLESVTLAKYPELISIKEEFISFGALAALMSGSGPTVFGLFDDKNVADVGAEKFKKKYPENVFLAKSYQD